MNVGDEQYRKLFRRLTTLQLRTQRTPKQIREMVDIDARLIEAELRFEAETHAPTMRDLVDDYDQLRNMGDLGGLEIL